MECLIDGEGGCAKIFYILYDMVILCPNGNYAPEVERKTPESGKRGLIYLFRRDSATEVPMKRSTMAEIP